MSGKCHVRVQRRRRSFAARCALAAVTMALATGPLLATPATAAPPDPTPAPGPSASAGHRRCSLRPPARAGSPSRRSRHRPCLSRRSLRRPACTGRPSPAVPAPAEPAPAEPAPAVPAPVPAQRPVPQPGETARATAARPGPTPAADRPNPVVRRLKPAAGTNDGGTRVTVTGARFGGAVEVLFGGVPGTDLVVSSDTVLSVTTPPVLTGATSTSGSSRPRGAAPETRRSTSGSSAPPWSTGYHRPPVRRRGNPCLGHRHRPGWRQPGDHRRRRGPRGHRLAGPRQGRRAARRGSRPGRRPRHHAGRHDRGGARGGLRVRGHAQRRRALLGDRVGGRRYRDHGQGEPPVRRHRGDLRECPRHRPHRRVRQRTAGHHPGADDARGNARRRHDPRGHQRRRSRSGGLRLRRGVHLTGKAVGTRLLAARPHRDPVLVGVVRPPDAVAPRLPAGRQRLPHDDLGGRPVLPRGPRRARALPATPGSPRTRPRSSSSSTSATTEVLRACVDLAADARRLRAVRRHHGQALGAGRRHPRRDAARSSCSADSDTSWQPGTARRRADAVRRPAGRRRSAPSRTSTSRSTSVWRRVADWLVNLRYYDYVPAMARARRRRLPVRPHRRLPPVGDHCRCCRAPGARVLPGPRAASPATTAG